MEHDRARGYGRIAAGVLVVWVLIVVTITGIGKLIMILSAPALTWGTW